MEKRRPLSAAKLKIEPMLAANPVTIVVTGHAIKLSISKMANPENISPPGEFMKTVIGSSGPSCSSKTN